MKEKSIGSLIGILLLSMLLIITGLKGIRDYVKIKTLEEKIILLEELEELNEYITKNNALEIEKAVLEERIKWLEKNDTQELSQELKDDIEEVITVIVYYYEQTDKLVSLDEWFKNNHPKLYDRMMNDWGF